MLMRDVIVDSCSAITPVPPSSFALFLSHFSARLIEKYPRALCAIPHREIRGVTKRRKIRTPRI